MERLIIDAQSFLIVALPFTVLVLWELLWTHVWKPGTQLIKTWRTLDVRVIRPKTTSFEKIGLVEFDVKVSGFLKAGFSVEGGYCVYTKTKGPLGNPKLRRKIIRGNKGPAPPLASPHPTPDVKEEYLPDDSLYPYRLTLCCVLVHPELRCQVLVTASGPAGFNGSPPKFRFGFLEGERLKIQMQLVSRNEDWQYSTFSSAPSHELLFRKPHKLFTYCGKITHAAILEKHLSRRAEIARTGNFEWESPHALPQLMEDAKSDGDQLRDWARRHLPIQVAFFLWRLKREQDYEWLGSLRSKP